MNQAFFQTTYYSCQLLIFLHVKVLNGTSVLVQSTAGTYIFKATAPLSVSLKHTGTVSKDLQP